MKQITEPIAEAIPTEPPASAPVARPAFDVRAWLTTTLQDETDFEELLTTYLSAAAQLDADHTAFEEEQAAPRSALLAQFYLASDVLTAAVLHFGAKAFVEGLKAAS